MRVQEERVSVRARRRRAWRPRGEGAFILAELSVGVFGGIEVVVVRSWSSRCRELPDRDLAVLQRGDPRGSATRDLERSRGQATRATLGHDVDR